MDRKLAYLLGALRDGSVDIRKGKNYEIKIGQKNREWLVILQKIIAEKFGYTGSITRHCNNYYILRITEREVVEKILKISGMRKGWKTPKIIKDQPLEVKKEYVKGFFDAEGGLPRNPQKWRYISFDQKEKEPLRFIRKVLVECKIATTRITFTSGAYQFRITRKESIVKFAKEVGSLHPDKRKRLKLLIFSMRGS